MFALLVLGGVIAALFYYIAIRPMSYWKKQRVAQGNPMWFLGDNLKVILRTESFAEFDQRLYSRYKHLRYSGLYQMTTPMLILHDPELIKQITVKDFDHFLDHQVFVPDNADLLWSKNLFALRGQKWREMRPILSPSFTTSKMKTIFVLMSESVENFIKHFSGKRDTILQLEMKDVLSRVGNDIIATTAFGIKVDSLTKPDNEFYLMGKEVTDFSGIFTNIKFFLFMVIPKFFEFFEIGLFSKAARKFFTDIITETIKTREEKKLVRPDMIHLLMEARKGKAKQEENGVIDTGFATVQEAGTANGTNTVNKSIEITDLDIAAQAMIFFFAGFETVTNLMAFLAYELAIHKDIQDRLREEIRETESACDGKLTYEVLMQMKYMDMVVSEVLRKWPIAVATDRVCTKSYTIEPKRPGERPVHLKPGQVIWIPMFGIHRDPDYYPDPEKFDPERFSEENKSKIIPYTYYPFGLGPRNCIASRFALMEIKLLFHHLLLNFELVPTEKTPIPAVISRKSFTLSIEGGFHVGMKQIRQKDD